MACFALATSAAVLLTLGAQPPSHRVSLARARAALTAPTAACATGDEASQVDCLLQRMLRPDAQAVKLAEELWRRGDLVSLLPAQEFDGGYRGTIRLEPQLPTGSERRHLEYVAGALADIDEFFAALGRRSDAAPDYRWSGLVLRFFRSVEKRTPAAFAADWTVAYNVNGTLNGSRETVRGLLFHEIFHLNDDGWSERALAADYQAIVRRCGTSQECLAPYVPEPLVVRGKGGTYYAFMPGNGVGEYAADLALRYFREQSARLAGQRVAKPFKCGPRENRRSWDKLVQRYFAGVDLVPDC